MEQELIQEFKKLEESSNFISVDTKEFSDKYTKKFIAVYGNCLIAVDDNFDNLIEKVKILILHRFFLNTFQGKTR